MLPWKSNPLLYVHWYLLWKEISYFDINIPLQMLVIFSRESFYIYLWMNWLELISERVDFDSILHLTSSKLVNFLQSDISWTQSSFSELYHWLHFSSLVSHQQLLSLQLSLTLQYPFTNSKQSKYSQTTMAVANHWNGCANDFSFCFVWWQQKEQWDKVNISTEKRIAYF